MSVPIRRAQQRCAGQYALAALERYLARCKLAANTVVAYRPHAAAYVAWLDQRGDEYGDAFADVVGAEAAVTLLYEHGARLRVASKRARVTRPDEPDALTPTQQNRLVRQVSLHVVARLTWAISSRLVARTASRSSWRSASWLWRSAICCSRCVL